MAAPQINALKILRFVFSGLSPVVIISAIWLVGTSMQSRYQDELQRKVKMCYEAVVPMQALQQQYGNDNAAATGARKKIQELYAPLSSSFGLKDTRVNTAIETTLKSTYGVQTAQGTDAAVRDQEKVAGALKDLVAACEDITRDRSPLTRLQRWIWGLFGVPA